jgi:hypothetical protein
MAVGGQYEGKFMQIGKKFYVVGEYKKGKYTVTPYFPATSGEEQKPQQSEKGKKKGKKKEKLTRLEKHENRHKQPVQIKLDKLDKPFRILSDDFRVAFTEPLIQQTMEQWSMQKLKEIDDEKAEFEEEHEVTVAQQLSEYLKETARQELIAAATAAKHWSNVATRGFRQFSVSFKPTAEVMEPELIEAAGGIDAILRQTWINMPRADRAVIETSLRKEMGGAVEIEGFALGAGEVKKYRAAMAVTLRKGFSMNSSEVWRFEKGEKIRAYERRVNEQGITRIRTEAEISGEDGEVHLVKGWLSETSKATGEDLLVPVSVPRNV